MGWPRREAPPVLPAQVDYLTRSAQPTVPKKPPLPTPYKDIQAQMAPASSRSKFWEIAQDDDLEQGAWNAHVPTVMVGFQQSGDGTHLAMHTLKYPLAQPHTPPQHLLSVFGPDSRFKEAFEVLPTAPTTKNPFALPLQRVADKALYRDFLRLVINERATVLSRDDRAKIQHTVGVLRQLLKANDTP